MRPARRIHSKQMCTNVPFSRDKNRKMSLDHKVAVVRHATSIKKIILMAKKYAVICLSVQPSMLDLN